MIISLKVVAIPVVKLQVQEYKIQKTKNESTSKNTQDLCLSLLKNTLSNLTFNGKYRLTPPVAEILYVKNGRVIVVCGFLLKLLKKHILKV